MVTNVDVEALAKLAGLHPGTLGWMNDPLPTKVVEPPPRFPYDPLTDDEWEVICPLWPVFNQARTEPRSIVNGLLKIASTDCGWRGAQEFATDEALRQQFQRRKKSGVLGRMIELLRERVGDVRLGQLEQLARW